MSNPPIDYYVDPSINANSGAGTSGDPYGDLQYALDTVTRNGTHGDRFNIKAGTAESLSAALSLTTYGTPAFGAPLIFQGYTSTQGDGGIGSIDCNTTAVITNAGSGICWYDMELTDGPAAAYILPLTQYGVAANVRVSGHNGGGIQTSSSYCLIAGCSVTDVGGASYDGIHISQTFATVVGNYVKNGATRNMRTGIYVSNQGCNILNNIVSVDDGSNGIDVTGGNGYRATIMGNTVLSGAGTGTGINIGNANGLIGLVIVNNYVEGFSDTGGIGFDVPYDSSAGGVYGQNAAFDNTTEYNVLTEHVHALGDNETLGATGLAKSGSDTFANRFTYFAPVDQGNMIDGGWPET